MNISEIRVGCLPPGMCIGKGIKIGKSNYFNLIGPSLLNHHYTHGHKSEMW